MDQIDRLKIEKEHLLKKLAKVDREMENLTLYRGYAEHEDFILDMVVKFNDLHRGVDIELSIPMTAKVLVRYIFAEEYLFDQSEKNIFHEVYEIGLEDTDVSEAMIKDLFHEFPSNNSMIIAYDKCQYESKDFKVAYDAFIAEFDSYILLNDLDDCFKSHFIMKYYS